jgi:hypothetical protein
MNMAMERRNMGTHSNAGNKGMVGDEHGSEESRDPGPFTLLQTHYLGLLERVISVRNSYQADPGQEEWLLKAINKATYSAFRSCIEHGAEAEAKAVLGGNGSEAT